jgi:hydrogenase-4 component B
MFWIVVLGFVIFITGKKFHLFHLKLPYWLSLEYIFFLPAYLVMSFACKVMYGDRCPIEASILKRVKDSKDTKIGFTERFVITMNIFNRKYESSIIQSDAFIYTSFIALILSIMFIFGVF